MTSRLPIISISFHKNSGNRIGKFLRPVWHLLASWRNPLPPCGRLWQFWWQLRWPPELPVLPLPQTELSPAAIQSISRHVCNVMQCRRAQRPLLNKMGSSVEISNHSHHHPPNYTLPVTVGKLLASFWLISDHPAWLKSSFGPDFNHFQQTLVPAEPAPPRSLFAVNTTHSSVTLLWTEDGVVDYYQVLCRPSRTSKELKAGEPITSTSHVLTVSGLIPSSSYNCTVTSFSYSTPSRPARITVSTTAKEMNPSMVAISALAVLSILLISLLVLFLLVLRKKHLQMTRDCGAETFVNFASFERDGKLPYNWRRSLFAFLTLLPSCLWTDYLLAFYINPW
ncbi:hypothetical protein ILYODFUR_010800 [Ilyodon furcidens]|uniref:Fibronectin type-III domain-containing protein n=1 Tax=Ilyodon furcidens TaxID=33524 RepID=A0ABV0SK65_9TELE